MRPCKIKIREDRVRDLDKIETKLKDGSTTKDGSTILLHFRRYILIGGRD